MRLVLVSRLEVYTEACKAVIPNMTSEAVSRQMLHWLLSAIWYAYHTCC